MNFFRKLIGPKSKYLTFLPFTYEGRVDVLRGQGKEPLYEYYNADTLCGLIEFLKEKEVEPDEVEIFEIYKAGDFKIKNRICMDENHHWLTRPHICHALTGKYIGHSEEGDCFFQDRYRHGTGPYG